jgi:hypothetical protein
VRRSVHDAPEERLPSTPRVVRDDDSTAPNAPVHSEPAFRVTDPSARMSAGPGRTLRCDPPYTHFAKLKGSALQQRMLWDEVLPTSHKKLCPFVSHALARASLYGEVHTRDRKMREPPLPQWLPGSSAVPPSCELPPLFNLRHARLCAAEDLGRARTVLFQCRVKPALSSKRNVNPASDRGFLRGPGSCYAWSLIASCLTGCP